MSIPPNLLATFLQEAGDLLAQIEDVVLDLNGRPADDESVNQLFRAFHTIKGSGSIFGFSGMVGFTHHVETALDRVRAKEVEATPELLEVVLAAGDEIRRLLEAAQKGETEAAGSDAIVARLQAVLDQPAPEQAVEPAAPHFRLRFRPHPDVLATGVNPQSILNELRTLGPCTVRAVCDNVPVLDHIQPDRCYLAWEIDIAAHENAIRDVFIFVEDTSEIRLEQTSAGAPGPGSAAVREAEPEALLPAAAGARQTAVDTSLRVSSEKLDRLVNLVGELVISQSRLAQSAAHLGAPELAAPVEEIERLVAELRDSVLGVRMMPIGATFSRFKRLVHDLSAELCKDVDLVTDGASTELDKTVLDKLSDPLVHLIRNSLDHGIEPAAERERLGKPRRGTVRLKAAHTGSHVVVSISDDGRGLDAARIRAKAVDKHLIAADAVLTEKEVLNLIFMPGFSTAAAVTKVSGRGVGMDAVKKQIEGLRGSVAVESKPAHGTSISLTLPLTLAIIEGLLTEVAGEQYIVPMSAVLENVELRRSERLGNNGRNVVAVRGELISYIPLREAFVAGGQPPEISRVVIVRHQGERVGLLVDRVIGTHQTVIQSLGECYRAIDVVSGSTIMGDGRVALILDVAGVIRAAERDFAYRG